MTAFDDAPEVEPASRRAWRDWLEANHATATSAWLIHRRAGGEGSVSYEEAVEEALCFGWIDSKGGRVDEHRTRLYFAPRKPRSGWADSNKARIERLAAAGLMRPAGLAVIERAKADGSWSVLDGAMRGEAPDDLVAALGSRPPARTHWDAFPPSAKRSIIGWIATARRPETRAKRVEEAATKAQRNERPRQFQPRE